MDKFTPIQRIKEFIRQRKPMGGIGDTIYIVASDVNAKEAPLYQSDIAIVCEQHTEMLSALEGAVGALEFSIGFCRDMGIGENDINFLKKKLDAVVAAIKKARGEA